MGRFVIGAAHGLAVAARGLTAAQADLVAAHRSLAAFGDGSAQTESVSVVDAKLAEARIHSTAEVVRTIDDMLGSLIDTVA
jgi:hypothetical protein